MMRHSEETISCDWDSEHALFRCYGPPEEEEAWLDEENPPGMLDELIEAAKKLTGDADEDGKTGLCGPGTHAVPVQGTIEVWFAPVVWHFGGGLCDQEVQMAAFASEAIGREDR